MAHPRDLVRAFTDPNYPTAFSSASRLRKHFKNKYTKEQIEDFLKSQDAYTKFAPRTTRFQRRFTLVHGVDEEWGVDLAIMTQFKKENRNVAYFALFVDLFNRKARAFTLKSRKPEEFIEKCRTLFKKAKPKRIFSDAEGAFTSKKTKAFFKSQGVEAWTARNSETHASTVESKIKIIKQRLMRWMHHTKSKNWTGILQQVVEGVNNSHTRNLGAAPNDVNTLREQQDAFVRLYGAKLGAPRKPSDLQPGAKVRVSLIKSPLVKKYLQSYGDEKFTVSQVLSKQGTNLYKLDDPTDPGADLIGEFYRAELRETR